MKKLKQTRVIKPNTDFSFADVKMRENSYATVIACFLDMESAEDCIQIQEHFPDVGSHEDVKWILVFSKWLEDKGYDWGSMEDHVYDNSHYIVLGVSHRGDVHSCIYKNGQLWHDPHPDDSGLDEELLYEYIKPLAVKYQ